MWKGRAAADVVENTAFMFACPLRSSRATAENTLSATGQRISSPDPRASPQDGKKVALTTRHIMQKSSSGSGASSAILALREPVQSRGWRPESARSRRLSARRRSTRAGLWWGAGAPAARRTRRGLAAGPPAILPPHRPARTATPWWGGSGAVGKHEQVSCSNSAHEWFSGPRRTSMVAEQRRSGGPSTASICRSEGAPPLLQPRPDLGQVSRLPEPERTQTAPPARGALADATGVAGSTSAYRKGSFSTPLALIANHGPPCAPLHSRQGCPSARLRASLIDETAVRRFGVCILGPYRTFAPF